MADDEEQNLNKDIYKDYRHYINEINMKEKDINNCISKFKDKMDSKENTFMEQNNLKKLLEEYYKKYSELSDAYKPGNVPTSLPLRELQRRQQEIQAFKFTYERMKKTLDEFRNQKYAFNKQVFNPNEEYKGDERMQDMSNQELKDYQKEKLNLQNNELIEIEKNAKKGIVLSNEIKAELKHQDLKLDDLEENIDQWDSGMKRVTKKFEKYITGSKTCCLIIILIVEVAIAIGIYFILKK